MFCGVFNVPMKAIITAIYAGDGIKTVGGLGRRKRRYTG